MRTENSSGLQCSVSSGLWNTPIKWSNIFLWEDLKHIWVLVKERVNSYQTFLYFWDWFLSFFLFFFPKHAEMSKYLEYKVFLCSQNCKCVLSILWNISCTLLLTAVTDGSCWLTVLLNQCDIDNTVLLLMSLQKWWDTTSPTDRHSQSVMYINH